MKRFRRYGNEAPFHSGLNGRFCRQWDISFKYLAKKAQETLVENRKARKMQLIDASLLIDGFYKEISLGMLALVAESG